MVLCKSSCCAVQGCHIVLPDCSSTFGPICEGDELFATVLCACFGVVVKTPLLDACVGWHCALALCFASRCQTALLCGSVASTCQPSAQDMCARHQMAAMCASCVQMANQLDRSVGVCEGLCLAGICAVGSSPSVVHCGFTAPMTALRQWMCLTHSRCMCVTQAWSAQTALPKHVCQVGAWKQA
jgi:hypothetical protein